MTTGEGGMIVTDNDSYAERLHVLRSHGMTTLTWDRHKGHAWSYDVIDLGYNYRIDEIRSALGVAQLKKLPANNEHRRALTQIYRDAFQELEPGVILPFREHEGISAAHLMPVLLPAGTDKSDFMEKMKSQGIQTSFHYPPIHTFRAYAGNGARALVPITEEVAQREVTLPLYPALSEEDIVLVVKAVTDSLGRSQSINRN
jgi:dTDP-4-amino-4,6-dideoxygalactose transaminase